MNAWHSFEHVRTKLFHIYNYIRASTMSDVIVNRLDNVSITFTFFSI